MKGLEAMSFPRQECRSRGRESTGHLRSRKRTLSTLRTLGKGCSVGTRESGAGQYVNFRNGDTIRRTAAFANLCLKALSILATTARLQLIQASEIEGKHNPERKWKSARKRSARRLVLCSLLLPTESQTCCPRELRRKCVIESWWVMKIQRPLLKKAPVLSHVASPLHSNLLSISGDNPS